MSEGNGSDVASDRPVVDDSFASPSPEEAISEEALAVIEKRVAGYVREAADNFYERVLEGVQEYLTENVRFNAAQRIRTAETQVTYYRTRWPHLVQALRIANDALMTGKSEHRELALRRLKTALDLSRHRIFGDGASSASTAEPAEVQQSGGTHQ